jgi:type IV pilus assembly protein PilA
MKKVSVSNQGFTLVELMIVVAIIGILSAVAVPNFKKYQAKAKTSEAKLALSGIYMAETSFQADSDQYAGCLQDMGVEHDGDTYYAIGFNAIGANTRDANGNVNGVKCTVASAFQFTSTKLIGGVAPATILGNIQATPPSNVGNFGTFEAEALGNLEGDSSVLDRWTINERKVVLHDTQDY